MDFLKEVGNLLITDYELSVLKKYDICVQKTSSFDEILLLIDRVMNEYDLSGEEYDELENVAEVLAERKYYMETKK